MVRQLFLKDCQDRVVPEGLRMEVTVFFKRVWRGLKATKVKTRTTIDDIKHHERKRFVLKKGLLRQTGGVRKLKFETLKRRCKTATLGHHKPG